MENRPDQEGRLNQIVQRATLEIIEFDNHTRYSMETIGRTLDCYVMTYLKSGQATIRLRGQIYECRPGTVALLPPNEPHDHVAARNRNDPAVFLWWHFRYQIADVLDVFRLFQYPVTFQIQKSLTFESIFAQYMELSRAEITIPNSIMRRAKGLEIMALLFESMLSLPGTGFKTEDIPPAFYHILFEIVERPEKEVRLQELSERFHMHPTYISNRFKHHFGVTPSRLHRSLVIGKSKELLRVGNLSISEISERMGFSDVSAYTQAFTELEGMSPSQFRQRMSGSGKDLII